MQHFTITGMRCAACSARVEKAVSALAGVEQCTVNLLTGSAAVSGPVEAAAVIAAVEAAGYHAALRGQQAQPRPTAEAEERAQTGRLIVSLVLLLPLMYCAMGHNMWSWPLPAFFHENPVAIGLLQLLK